MSIVQSVYARIFWPHIYIDTNAHIHYIYIVNSTLCHAKADVCIARTDFSELVRVVPPIDYSLLIRTALPLHTSRHATRAGFQNSEKEGVMSYMMDLSYVSYNEEGCYCLASLHGSGELSHERPLPASFSHTPPLCAYLHDDP